MPIEYDPAEMPGAQQVLNGTRALLQYLHASKITVLRAWCSWPWLNTAGA
ncbi:hypothetical protein [Verrucomicrobium spinosum]|nr:hypothetical protein [Verrucomicrobium spinosum]